MINLIDITYVMRSRPDEGQIDSLIMVRVVACAAWLGEVDDCVVEDTMRLMIVYLRTQ